MNSSLDLFDSIVAINLPHRGDRRVLLLETLEKVSAPMEKLTFIEAVHDPLNGHRGCALSHIKALEHALENSHERTLILEDDFEFTCDSNSTARYVDAFFAAFEENWDIFFLGTNVMASEPALHDGYYRVTRSNTSHGYAINLPYVPRLKKCIEFAVELMENDLFHRDTILGLRTFDHVWKILQERDRWYIGKPSAGVQRTSYSDTGDEMIARYQNECESCD